MNKIFLLGGVVRDPEVRYSQGDNSTAVANYSIAVERRFKRDGEPDADFFNCVSFGKQAEFVERNIKKGSRIAIIGRLQNDNYTNKEGQKVYQVRVIVDEIEFAGPKPGNGGESSNGGGSGRQSAFDGNAASEGFMNIPDGIDEELPFN